ncbi:MAG: hypothetical protein IT289_00830 [Oligoflexia bacterium]|nr:hypothetical protein [Oligoflexia bacterium]
MSSNNKKSFHRQVPTVTGFLEKPMARWASGKVKRLYNGYDSFCQEIGRLLGDIETQPKISNQTSISMLEEFEWLWTEGAADAEAHQQLLSLLSNFYKAGFIFTSDPTSSFIQSYFIEESWSMLTPLIGKNLQRLSPKDPHLAAEPMKLRALPLLKAIGLKNLDWVESSLAVHFWLNPQRDQSLIVVTDSQEPLRSELVQKTQSLIDRRFCVQK